MRLDRFITLTLVRPFRRTCDAFFTRPASAGNSLPILMYHSISAAAESNVPAYYRTCTAPKVFAQHLLALKSAGYCGVDLSTGLAWLQSQANAQRPTLNVNMRPVVLTFDDGFRDFHTQALPLLVNLGFTATMFLPSQFIKNVWQSFQGREYMCWADVLEAVKHGVQVGTHTASHTDLRYLAWSDVVNELRECRVCLEDRLGAPVTSFSYPFGFPLADKSFCRQLRVVLAECGYQNCLTTIIGRVQMGDDLFALRRLPVNGDTDPAFLLAKISGFYDWMRRPQLLSKSLKHLFPATTREVRPNPHR